MRGERYGVRVERLGTASSLTALKCARHTRCPGPPAIAGQHLCITCAGLAAEARAS